MQESAGAPEGRRTMNGEIGLRALKKARSKIAAYEASLDLIGASSFRDVKLEDICARAEVSKVTFFKFFATKEDVLIYFMHVWLLERMLELEEGDLRGTASIRHLLKGVADEAGKRPGLMLSLIGFLAETKMHPSMPALSDAELRLLFPGREERARAATADLFALFCRLVDEARADGERMRQEPTERLAQWLLTVFYGGFLTAHLCRQDIMSTYDQHLGLLFATKGGM